ncbi:unnamed protein product, partial [marine sediment metagenome]
LRIYTIFFAESNIVFDLLNKAYYIYFREYKFFIETIVKILEDRLNEIQKFGFNEGQLRLIILILSILQIRGKPRNCLETLMKDWKFPEYKLDPANSARYYFLAWLYHLPSQIIQS